jgi:hypothetical protein
MFKVDDRVRVATDDIRDVAEGTLGTVAEVCDDGFIMVVIDGYTHDALDSLFAAVLGAPAGSLPIRASELELADV